MEAQNKINTPKLYWHVHHQQLAEITENAEERRKYIREGKPWNERARRLRLMRPVRGKTGDQTLFADMIKAFQRWTKDKRHRNFSLYQLSISKYLESIDQTKLAELHQKECGSKNDCPWDGNTIFPTSWINPLWVKPTKGLWWEI